ncbi:TetR/AcrR family transcriptional regulator [Tepidicaulis sp.]|uniref:TetR/AcrR family transcriptional regulator n=1 Tax=Tepidicaulis sp. TaxID=1920809 RepID=UPI003B59AD4B
MPEKPQAKPKSKARKPAKPRAYHHGDLKAALVEAGARIVERDGVMALSLRGVAREAGVSQTAPYHHFADKEALLAEIAATGFRDLSAEMARRGSAIAGASPRLGALGTAYVLFATENPGRFRLMFGPLIGEKASYPALLEASSGSYQMIREAVAAYLEEIRRDAENLEAATMAAWSLVHGLATLINDRGFDSEAMGAPDIETLSALVTSYLRNGLGR